MDAEDDSFFAVAAAAVAECRPRECHQCFKRKTHDGAKIKLWYCQACMHARYCSAACQHTHWREHKSACKQHARGVDEVDDPE